MTQAKRIGKYPVIREIGKGAMGTVYEGFDPDTGEKVAIKVLRAEHLADAAADGAQARFEREALATQRLRHTNIVSVHEYGVQGRIRFIAMELLDGRELRDVMREAGRIGIEDASYVLLQLLDALGHSHRHGVVHRDIKPSNVMVTPGMRIKVMDFGIARIESAAFTQMGTMLGTPSYMSPEQMRGEPVDGRADLWAAGVMLYEMLAGRGPFPRGYLLEALNNPSLEPAPLSSLIEGSPATLDDLMRRALARRIEDRFQEAGEFARELTKVAALARADVVDVDVVLEPEPPPAGPAAVDVSLDLPPS
jgi:serine/threonine protein kinase